MKRCDKEGKWQAKTVRTVFPADNREDARHALNNDECDVGFGRYAAADTLKMVFGQAKSILTCDIHRSGRARGLYLIAPPTSCPRFRDTIQKARYLPRDCDGARDIIVPASATYQVPVPMPENNPLRIRYCSQVSWKVAPLDAIEQVGAWDVSSPYTPIVFQICYCSSKRSPR